MFNKNDFKLSNNNNCSDFINRESYGENNVQDILNDYKSMTYQGSDVSGSVWTNNDYNNEENNPGLAWVL